MCGRIKLLSTAETEELTQELQSIGANLAKALSDQLSFPELQDSSVRQEARIGTHVPYLNFDKSTSFFIANKATWGFSAPWTRSLIFNTRIESANNTFWQKTFDKGRCIVSCASFFEPAKDEMYLTSEGKSRKRQYEFSDPSARVLLLAAISDGSALSVVTRPAELTDSAIHDRMPLALDAKDVLPWLEGDIASANDVSYKALKSQAEGGQLEQLSIF